MNQEIIFQNLLEQLKQVQEELKANAINDVRHDLQIQELTAKINNAITEIENLRKIISSETLVKAGIFDKMQNIFAKKMFWIILLACMAFIGFGMAGILSNTDNVVKIAKTIKGSK